MIAEAVRKDTGTRLFFVDNLRVALIALVVLHHLSVIYAANTSFYYLEPAYQDVVALVALVVFQLFNQAYFMGLFFLISGYFTPSSFDRKGAGTFLKDRLLRLGIPLLLFELVLSPLASIGRYFKPADLGGITTPFTWQQYPEGIGIGPLWFVAMLLALALRGVHPEQFLKFGLAAIIGVPLCFAVAYLVRRMPLAARIL